MKKFRLEWREKVLDDEGFFLHYEIKNQVLEAENEDDACDQWDTDNEYNDAQNGLTSCVEIVEHPLFEKHIHIEMPNGCCYAIPVEFIAHNRAERFAKDSFNGDAVRSLVEDTLPLFDKNEAEIKFWASTEMKWNDVEGAAKIYQKRILKEDLEKTWLAANYKIA